MASNESFGGNNRRFSGESLDPRELRRWRLWAEARMASTKDMAKQHRGPFVFCLLDGLALEACEHLTLEKLKEEDGDKHIWAALEERFPDRLSHDWLAECLKEVFELAAKDGETMAAWTSRVQETFSKCRRKVSVEFPSPARGWICLNASGLSPDQRAIVTAKTQGDLNFEAVVAAMRSCFPEFKAKKTARAVPAFLVQPDEPDEGEHESGAPSDRDGPDAVVFDEVEAFLAEHGLQDGTGSDDVFDEGEIAEVLAATWKERRTEIARLQKTRRFGQASAVKKQFSRELSDLQKRSRCRKCNQIGHWARNCPQKSSASTSNTDKTHGAAMAEEVFLVSSPGYGILDSGCSRTLIGQETLNQFLRMYHDRKIPTPSTKPQQNVFRFGNGQEEVSERVVSMPVFIHGKASRIEAAIIKGAAPLLLSRNTLRSLKAVIDFAHETVSFGGAASRPLQINSAGQFVLNMLDVEPEEVLVCDTSETSDDSDTSMHWNGCERQMTVREQRCMLAQHSKWKTSQSTCTVAELFSPPRFTMQVEKKGERGLAYDIQQGWDLTDKAIQKQVDQQLEEERPELLVCCPECKHWGGWYRLNRHSIPVVQQLLNQRKAKAQADFCVWQIRKQLKRGGRVLVEHPWSSDLWKYPPVKQLLSDGSLSLHRADMCAYELADSDSGQAMKKPTGLAVSHDDMASLSLTCPGHERHQLIEGHTRDGRTRSCRAAEYTDNFVTTWLKCVRPQWSLCHFACLQDHSQTTEHVSREVVAEVCAASEVQKVEQLVRKLHNNLGHPSTRTLERILKNAGASEEALKAAGQVESSCDICQQRQRPTPCLPASPEKFQDFNHRIGWDVKILPGWQVNQQVKALNIVDYATSFQIVVPFFERETAEVLKKIFLEAWQRWAGVPVEVIVDPAKTNTAEGVFDQLEQDGTRVVTIAAEAHNQLGKVEKHGHLFEVILQKVLDQVQPRTREEYEQCVTQTGNAKNELINQKGLSPCQLVFGRNPRIPSDLMQEFPCPVAATTPLHDEAAERARAIRAQARVSLVMSQDDASLRTALNARPRVEREFLPGDLVAYWRTQKYQKGIRIVGGRWYGVAIVMGKVGRNFLIFHRKNIFKVAPEHLRHASEEERVLAQADGREMLGLSSLLNNPDRKEIGSQFTDLVNTPTPSQSHSVKSLEDVWLIRGDHLCRIHRQPRTTTFWPSPNDPALQGISLENWRKTIRSDTNEVVVHQPLSDASCQNMTWGELPWKGESQFRMRPKRGEPSSSAVGTRSTDVPMPDEPSRENTLAQDPQTQTETGTVITGAREEPYARTGSEPPSQPDGYGPVRVRQHFKSPPTFLLRPPEVHWDDMKDMIQESHGVKRSHSPEGAHSEPSKSQKTDDIESCLFTELVAEHGPAASVEVLIASFLQKKMQKELHHSHNPSELQEKVDIAKTTEWTTLRDEKQALKVIMPRDAARIRSTRPDRIMTSRFVIVEKHEDGDSKIKARWCLRGHHDPDLFTKVLAGKCHSPTLSQFGRSLILQMLVSNRWKMHLGDIKGAFLEADVRQKAIANPVYAELPPGGVPGVDVGSLVQILGNIYGANDAPHEWYCEFDRVALEAGFVRSKFDSCLYLCYGEDHELQGILGAHVDDTITGGCGPRYEAAVAKLRSRFPFRKWRSGTGEFLGTIYTQDQTTLEISFQQKEYAEHITPIKITKERSRKPWLPATPQEVSALRAVNGALSWVSTQSRPDLAVQTSLSQQCFPQPKVSDLIQANQAVRRARQQSDLCIQVPFIPLKELTLCFWSDAAFANTTEHKTQAGWLLAFTSNKMRQGEDVPVHCFAWKSYRLPRVVASTMGGEAQAYSTATGVCEWMLLMMAECLDGPVILEEAEEILQRRSPIGMTDCRSLYDHLTSLGSGGTVDDKRTAIDIAIIRQSLKRCTLEPRWCPTNYMVADAFTKDRAEPVDLLRAVLRSARYQLADEQIMLDRRRAEKDRRREIAQKRAEQNSK